MHIKLFVPPNLLLQEKNSHVQHKMKKYLDAVISMVYLQSTYIYRYQNDLRESKQQFLSSKVAIIHMKPKI